MRQFIFLSVAILYGIQIFSLESDPKEKFSERQMVIMNITDNSMKLRAALIMDMMDANENKAKDKILAVLLEVEFECLKMTAHKRIGSCEEVLASDKKHLRTCKNQYEIHDCLEEIESIEKNNFKIKESLLLIEQWEEQYCY